MLDEGPPLNRAGLLVGTMNLRDQMAADLAEIHGDPAFSPSETVTWYPADGGAAVPGVVGVFQSDGRGRSQGDAGEHNVQAGRFLVTVAQRATVEIGDKIERTGIGGTAEVWTVVEIPSETPVLRKLLIQRAALARFVGAGDRLSVGKAAPV